MELILLEQKSDLCILNGNYDVFCLCYANSADVSITGLLRHRSQKLVIKLEKLVIKFEKKDNIS